MPLGDPEAGVRGVAVLGPWDHGTGCGGRCRARQGLWNGLLALYDVELTG